MSTGSIQFDNLEAALDYLYRCLPVFQNEGKKAYKPSLDNTLRLLDKLGNPHLGLRCVHIAGTNGKGSVSHILASVFQSSGLTTGLYTSPHLVHFSERIKVNGQPVPPTELLRLINSTLHNTTDMQPSFFEYTTALAFQFFHHYKADISVIETGLGGRLDSTNVVSPLISVITNIGWDHTDILGTTLEAIATEKAGIVKPGVPLIVGEYHPLTAPIFVKKAKDTTSPIIFADQETRLKLLEISSIEATYECQFTHPQVFGNGFRFTTDLTARYQQKNLITAITTLKALNLMDDSQIISGLEKSQTRSGFTGRWQTLQTHPRIICDTAHNPDGMRTISEELKYLKTDKLFILIGMVKDKDISGSLQFLPSEARYYYTRPNSDRAALPEELSAAGSLIGRKGHCYPSVKDAWEAASSHLSDDDTLLVTGSNYLVGEFLALYGNLSNHSK